MREKPGLKVGPFQFSLKQFNVICGQTSRPDKAPLENLVVVKRKAFQVAEEEKSRGSGIH